MKTLQLLNCVVLLPRDSNADPHIDWTSQRRTPSSSNVASPSTHSETAAESDLAHRQLLCASKKPRVLCFQLVSSFVQIIDNGHAYAVAGDVYFTVDSFPEYGALSGRKQEENRAGERVAVDERKKNPADFALWKVSWLYLS